MRKEWLEQDYYQTLGVARNASDRSIKKAFRKLAQEHHPDANRGEASAENRFKEINEAYDVIGDKERRSEYDKVRQMGYIPGGHSKAPGQPGGRYSNVDDLLRGASGGSPSDVFERGFGDFFSGRSIQPTPGRDLRTELKLSFHQAIRGITKELNIGGPTVKVKIPCGVADGTKIRLRGKGEPSPNGGEAGDLYVTVGVASHPIFERSGKRDLRLVAPVTLVEATLGADVTVPTLSKNKRLRIPTGTPHGKTFRVVGMGVTDPNGITGDLLVTVEIAIPTDLTETQVQLLREFEETSPATNPRQHLGV